MSKLIAEAKVRLPETQAATQEEFNISSEYNDVDTILNLNCGEIGIAKNLQFFLQ